MMEAPSWRPGKREFEDSNLARYLRKLGLADYAALHAFSVKDRAGFWKGAIEHLGIPFATPPRTVLEGEAWLPGARLNIADACLRGDPKRRALVSVREDGTRRRSAC